MKRMRSEYLIFYSFTNIVANNINVKTNSPTMPWGMEKICHYWSKSTLETHTTFCFSQIVIYTIKKDNFTGQMKISRDFN